MASGLVGNFTTGRPYVMPNVGIAKPQFNISVPNLPKLPDDEDPTNEKNPSDNNNGKSVSSPKSTSNNNNLWGSLSKDIGIGVGVGGTALGMLKHAISSPGQDAEDVIDAGKGIFTKGVGSAAEDLAPVVNAGSKVINGADYNVLQPTEAIAENAPKALSMNGNWGEEMANGLKGLGNLVKSPAAKTAGDDLGKIGTSAAEGEAIEAPLEAGTIAVGGGPEDPFADAAAGLEGVTGAGIDAGMTAAPMIGSAVKNMFSLVA